MLAGTVVAYDRERGYGLIEPDDGSGPVLVHQAAVEQAGLTSLEAGQRLEFQLSSRQDEDDRQMTEEAKEAGRRLRRFAEDLWPL
jgi:CspA family cold shock protein